ncbi:MAG: AAA family ATPase, partial [Bacteroidota bacterium]|nr:AAA family ATPase [Bacteroidota bacterium]
MYRRSILEPIELAMVDTPVIVITGARQTGKSTLCRQLLEGRKFRGKMVTLDDPSTLAAALADPLGFMQGQDKHLIIDEIQRAPELLLSIKKLVDEDRTERRLIITGSADVMAMPKVADSLAGRTEIHHLWPLAQSEIHQKSSIF